ncbi:MAG: carboxymuconolactone decarboxylase family protein [Phycisphaerae bacterium]
MPRIQAIDPKSATGAAKDLLDKVTQKFGKAPNMMRTMAQSPAVLQGYLALSAALDASSLTPRLREQIALAVAQTNHCEYCLAAHSTIGKMVGLPETEIAAARRITSEDRKTEAALRFAQRIANQRGVVSDAEYDAVRAAGWTDAQIAEIVATVSLNELTNYFNIVAQTEVDFPRAAALVG